MNTTNFTDSDANLTTQQETAGKTVHHEYIVSFFFVYIPGITLNIIALVIISRDAKQLQLPTNVLFLLLCASDLGALFTSFFWHIMNFVYVQLPENICHFKTIINPFFPIFTGEISALLSLDRMTALAMPFFYREKITSTTWKVLATISAFLMLLICTFPSFGLGSIWSSESVVGNLICSSLSFQIEQTKRVFGVVYSVIGLIIIVEIILSNIVVISVVLRMKKRVDTVIGQTASPESNNSIEIMFAQLVGVLTVLYVICWLPYYMINLLMSFGYQTSRRVTGVFHGLAGINYVVDPIVYIWKRKSIRKKILSAIYRCYSSLSARPTTDDVV